MGNDSSIQREFNIDSIGKEYVFDSTEDFIKNISFLSNNINIKLGSNEYISGGGIYEIENDGLAFYVSLNIISPIDINELLKFYDQRG